MGRLDSGRLAASLLDWDFITGNIVLDFARSDNSQPGRLSVGQVANLRPYMSCILRAECDFCRIHTVPRMVHWEYKSAAAFGQGVLNDRRHVASDLENRADLSPSICPILTIRCHLVEPGARTLQR
jgi:hypothetical protein